MVTLKDISQLAGTSTATVSLVLNGKRYDRVSPETRERIEQLASEMGYTPNRQAQALQAGKTGVVAVLVNDISNPFFSRYVAELESRLVLRDLHPSPLSLRVGSERLREIQSLAHAGFCDAIIDLTTAIAPADAGAWSGKPLIVRVTNGAEDSSYALPHVAVDQGPAVRRLLAGFASAGRRRFGTLQLPTNSPVAPRTLHRSYLSRLLAEQIDSLGLDSPASSHRTPSEYAPMGDWRDAAAALLADNPDLDALLVHNARVLPAVTRAIHQAGRTVGEDLALATFDDTPGTQWSEPPVTVVREPVADTADLLIDAIDAVTRDPQATPANARVSAELVVRASTPGFPDSPKPAGA